MEVSIPRPQPREDGDYKTYVSACYGKPTAIIHLAENGALDLRDLDVDDCDRLIKAAVEVKTQLLRYQAMAAAPHGRDNLYQGTCQLCGKPEADALHAEPVPAAADGACADCGHLVCDCGADGGDDPTDSIAEGHDADVAAAAGVAPQAQVTLSCGCGYTGPPVGVGTPAHCHYHRRDTTVLRVSDAQDDPSAAAPRLTGADVLLAAAEMDIAMREPDGLEDAAAQDEDEDEADDPFIRPTEKCGARPYPAGSEGDDGTECVRPNGHPGEHSDEPIPFDEPTAAPAGTVLLAGLRVARGIDA